MSLGRTQRLRLFLEDRFGRVFPTGGNPLYVLGALSFVFFWVLLATGIYLFFVYRFDIDGAYDSLQYLTERQWYWGGIVRSLHRYSADGLMIAMVLHGLRVFLADQYRHARWLAWVSGVVVIGFVWFEGILGYWMVWDDRAQFIALTTAEWLDVLPIAGVSLPRAFLSRDLVTNLFFFVIVALHIALPVLMLLLLWLHVSRITRPVINPPAGLIVGIVGILLILAAVYPATSGPRADPARLPVDLPLDWFYLGVYPFFTALPAGVIWLVLALGAALLVAVPWIGASRRPEPVSLVLPRCNACARCYEDCPYEAISMRPRTDGRPYDRQAQVEAERCVSCGICVGSCSTAALLLPEASTIGILTEIRKRRSIAIPKRLDPATVVVCCERAIPADMVREARPWMKPIAVPCIGAIHPLIIEQTLRAGAAGVFLVACPEGDCHDRVGNQWLTDRLAGRREPYLKRAVDRSKVRLVGFSAAQTAEAIAEIERFAKGLQPDQPPAGKRWALGAYRRLAAGAVLVLPALLIYAFSGRPSYAFFDRNESLLVVSLKYAAAPRECRPLEREELERLPEHMRPPLVCTRERRPVVVRLEIDGEERLRKTYPPTGLWSDGPAYVYEKFTLPPGVHDVGLRVEEVGGRTETIRSERLDFGVGRVVLLP